MIGPRKVERKINEAYVQSKCVDWMRKRGWWARKFSSPANRSVPDYLFSHATHGKLAVEFKAPGKRSTVAQLEEQQQMEKTGWKVLSDIDDIEGFKAWISQEYSDPYSDPFA